MPNTADDATVQDDNLPQETLDDAMDKAFEMFEQDSNAEYKEPDTSSETPDPKPDPVVPDPNETPAEEPDKVVEESKKEEPDPAKTEEPDPFDVETEEKLDEMKHDPHPGLKFKALRDELKTLKQELADAQNGVSNSEEVQRLKLQAKQAETLRAEAAELRSTLALNDYKSTDEYDTLVRKPIEESRTLANAIETDNGLPEGSVFNAIQHGDKATKQQLIEKLAEEGNLSMWDQTRIYTMADRHLQISATDAALKGTAEARMAELNDMQVSQQTAAQEEQSRALKGGVEQTFDRYEGKLPGFVTDDGVATDAFKQFKQEAASTQLNTIEDASFAIFAATLLPEILKTNKEMSAEIASKNKQLAKYGGAVPTGGTPSTPTKVVKKATTFMDALDEEFG